MKIDFTDPSIIAHINELLATRVMGYTEAEARTNQKIYYPKSGDGFYAYSWIPHTNLNQLAMVVRQLGESDHTSVPQPFHVFHWGAYMNALDTAWLRVTQHCLDAKIFTVAEIIGDPTNDH